MKWTKEKYIILILSVVLILTVTIGPVLFLHFYNDCKAEKDEWEEKFLAATAGNEIERDGLRQNDLIYLTDISVDKEKEYLFFTLHNGSNQYVHHGEDYKIEVKKDGKWINALSDQGHHDIAWTQHPFSDGRNGSKFPAEEQLPGEYRVYVNYAYSGSGVRYAVGYFTIPEAEP